MSTATPGSGHIFAWTLLGDHLMPWSPLARTLCPSRLALSLRIIPLLLFALLALLPGCAPGYNTPGRMEWVQPVTTTPRVGTVYCIRGWQGIFSVGIDNMAKQLRDQGVNALVYMPEQYPELAKTMVEKYKGIKNPEPICFIGHSRGVDSSIIISRELEKAGVPVALIVALDSVDERIVPANVKECRNYWMPGIFGDSNLLRGIPLSQEPGSTGKLYNMNLDTDPVGQKLKEPLTNHIDIDKAPRLQHRIVEEVLANCPERAVWDAQQSRR